MNPNPGMPMPGRWLRTTSATALTIAGLAVSVGVATPPATAAGPAARAGASATTATASSTTSSRPSELLPAPWGTATNGLVLYSTTAGDVASTDVATGVTATVVGGDPRDALAGWTRDGTRFAFERTVPGGTEFWMANADGADARMVLNADETRGWGWVDGAPDGHRIVVIPAAGGDATIVDVDSGARSTLDAPIPIRKASWLADGRMLIVSASAPGRPSAFATINEDGTGYTVVPTVDAVEEYSVSGDGNSFAYNGWGTQPGTKGLIRVVDLATGADTVVTDRDPNFEFGEPAFSPDSRWIKADRWDVDGLTIVLLPADGKGEPIDLGDKQIVTEGEGMTVWAPDASALIVTYSPTGETWLFDVASGSGAKVEWPDLRDHTSWQRIAP